MDRDWRRLAAYIKRTRMRQGYATREAFAEATGISMRTLGTLERSSEVSEDTLLQVEEFFGWGVGSTDSILRGGDPIVPTDPHPATRTERLADVRDWAQTDPDLEDHERAVILAYVEKAERAARRRNGDNDQRRGA